MKLVTFLAVPPSTKAVGDLLLLRQLSGAPRGRWSGDLGRNVFCLNDLLDVCICMAKDQVNRNSPSSMDGLPHRACGVEVGPILRCRCLSGSLQMILLLEL